MFKRRRFKQITTLHDRLAAWVQGLRLAALASSKLRDDTQSVRHISNCASHQDADRIGATQRASVHVPQAS